MRKNALNIILIFLSAVGFIWSVWQHETLFKYVLDSLWNGDFAFFWGIHAKWGIAYDYTLFLEFVCWIVPLLAVWFWKD